MDREDRAVPAPIRSDDIPTRIGWATLAVAVVPIWVSVVRTAQRGIEPFHDSALTVSVAREVFSTRPPLIGMSAAAARVTGFDTHFPGAWQLYAIAGPTEVLGNLWGPLVAMGLTNTLWIVLAGWLLLRRLPIGQAMLGVAFLSAFAWSVGGGYLVTPVPKEMLLVPFAAFLVAAACMAAGDRWAIPVTALMANYLWLDHLTLVLSIPAITLCAVTGLVWGVIRDARDDPHGARRRRRALRRPIVVAGGITVVMWLPPLIQQLTTTPGNLGLLVTSHGADRTIVGSWARALDWTGSVVLRPPFWLRSTMDDPTYLRPRIGPEVVDGLSLYVLVGLALLVALGAVLGVAAARRGDRTGVWFLLVALAAFVAGVVTTYLAPTLVGPPVDYLRPLTCVGMFIWFAIVLGVVRTVTAHRPGFAAWQNRRVAVAGVGLVVVAVSIANLTVAPEGYGTDTRVPHLAAAMTRAVVPAIVDRGTVMVIQDQSLYAREFTPALILASTSAGVDVCVSPEVADPHDGPPACGDDVGVRVHVAVRDTTSRVSGVELFRATFLDQGERVELARLRRELTTWARRVGEADLTPAARRLLTPGGTEPAALPLLVDGKLDRAALRTHVSYWYANPAAPEAALFEGDPLTAEQWRRWAHLDRLDLTLIVSETP